MIRALWSSASGMQAQQMNIDVISNNLANVNTSGFKRSDIQFEDLMYQTEKLPGSRLSDGSETATGLEIGHGSRAVSTAKNFSQGDLQNTSNKLDLAIEGYGFYEVELPDGTLAYTRDGSFKLTAAGEIVTNNGYKVSGVEQIDPEASEITISKDGTITIQVGGELQELSPITLTRFPNPQGLRSIGSNLYLETDASGQAETGLAPGSDGMGTIAQGFLESSNVRVVEEMVKMIQAQRAYEVNSKSIQASDEMLGIASNLRR